MLLDSEDIRGPFLKNTETQRSDYNIDFRVTRFDWTPSEVQRTPDFFSLIKNTLGTALRDFRLYDVKSSDIFSHAINEDNTKVTINGKTDGLIVVQRPRSPDIPVILMPNDSFIIIENKTDVTINDSGSIKSAITQLILLSLLSQYHVHAILTDGTKWYFFELVQTTNGKFQVEYEVLDSWGTGIGRLRYILQNFTGKQSIFLAHRNAMQNTNAEAMDVPENDEVEQLGTATGGDNGSSVGGGGAGEVTTATGGNSAINQINLDKTSPKTIIGLNDLKHKLHGHSHIQDIANSLFNKMPLFSGTSNM